MRNLVVLILTFLSFTVAAQTPAGIGDFCDGGVVFWINPNDSTEGFVCDIADLDALGQIVEWGCHGSFINGADGATIGTGAQKPLI
mgnify:CR=1 FL=1|jgi:hypothetical protein